MIVKFLLVERLLILLSVQDLLLKLLVIGFGYRQGGSEFLQHGFLVLGEDPILPGL